jgi:uncharacterized protein YjiS (DUF1127 family)
MIMKVTACPSVPRQVNEQGGLDGQSPASGFAPVPPPEMRASVLMWLIDWLDRQHQRAVLAELDDRLLDDIGVTREEAIRESRNRS